MHKFPIRIPDGWKLTITQGFASTDMAAFYLAKGINMPTHDGVDVVCGTGPQTFGSACVWPFPWPGTVYDSQVDSPMGAIHHAHAQIDTVDPDTGIAYSVVYIHLSAVTNTKVAGDGQKIVYNQGDVIGYIGNNGSVSPPPTPQNPFNGAHLHLGLGVKHPGESNYTMTDASLMFDINDPYRGNDDPSRDDAVYQWAATNGGSTVPHPDTPIKASDSIALLAAQKQAAGNITASKTLYALSTFLRSFGY